MRATDITKAFGARVRDLREKRGLSQAQLAERLGVRPGHLWKVEQGDHVPRIETLLVLAEELGASLDYLLAGDERRAAPPKTARLARRLKALEQLADEDVEAVLRLVDALLVARRGQRTPPG